MQKKNAKHKAHLKYYLSLNVFVNPLMTNITNANAMCSLSSSVTVKMATKISNEYNQLLLKK